MEELNFIEVEDEYGEKELWLEHKQALELSSKAIEKLSEKYEIEFTEEDHLEDWEENIRKGVAITVAKTPFTVKFKGWVVVKRYVGFEKGRVHFYGSIYLSDFDFKLDWRVGKQINIVMEFNYKKEEWSGYDIICYGCNGNWKGKIIYSSK